MRYYLGVDGGGTKTVCLLSDEDGQILSRGTAGPSNHHMVGAAQARYSLHACIRDALAQSCRQIDEIHSIVLGMAGLDSPGDHALLNQMLDELDIRLGLRLVDNDAIIALAGATAARPGVVVISGTGSICFGENEYGQRCRSGGWGPILGDEGSGYDIGRKALVAALHDVDGRGESTVLRPLIEEHLQLASIEDLVTRVYVQNMRHHEIASLARLVAFASEKGDLVAQELLRQAGSELARAAITVIRRLNMQSSSFEVGLAGGVFCSSKLLCDTVATQIGQSAPQAQIIVPRFEPVVGALLLALKQAGKSLDPQLIANIEQSIKKWDICGSRIF